VLPSASVTAQTGNCSESPNRVSGTETHAINRGIA
jgi:hypothetical protein